MSLSGNVLTVTGTNLPTNLIDVRLGDVGCGPVTGTATSVTCTLTNSPTAGTHTTVDVLSAEGVVPVGAVSSITVALSTTSVFPNTELNMYGGDIITITGTGLPQKI